MMFYNLIDISEESNLYKRSLFSLLNEFFGVKVKLYIYILKRLGYTNLKPLKLKDLNNKEKKKVDRILVDFETQIGPFAKRLYTQHREKLNSIPRRKSIRFMYGLPCNGQRTRTNAKTSKLRRPSYAKMSKKLRYILRDQLRRVQEEKRKFYKKRRRVHLRHYGFVL